jgi:hypothetical protein
MSLQVEVVERAIEVTTLQLITALQQQVNRLLWTCSCGRENSVAVLTCWRCGTDRLTADHRSQLPAPPGGWPGAPQPS